MAIPSSPGPLRLQTPTHVTQIRAWGGGRRHARTCVLIRSRVRGRNFSEKATSVLLPPPGWVCKPRWPKRPLPLQQSTQLGSIYNRSSVSPVGPWAPWALGLKEPVNVFPLSFSPHAGTLCNTWTQFSTSCLISLRNRRLMPLQKGPPTLLQVSCSACFLS